VYFLIQMYKLISLYANHTKLYNKSNCGENNSFNIPKILPKIRTHIASMVLKN